METPEVKESQVKRRFRKMTLLNQKIPLFFNFEHEYMFNKSDLDNTDWWSLCHDPLKGVKPRRITPNNKNKFSFAMLA